MSAENLCQHFESPITMRTMKNRDIFSRYIYDLHEKINGMLGKKSGISYEKARLMYENEVSNGQSGGANNSLSKENKNTDGSN